MLVRNVLKFTWSIFLLFSHVSISTENLLDGLVSDQIYFRFMITY